MMPDCLKYHFCNSTSTPQEREAKQKLSITSFTSGVQSDRRTELTYLNLAISLDSTLAFAHYLRTLE